MQQFIHHLEDQEEEQFHMSGMGDRAMQRFKIGKFCVGVKYHIVKLYFGRMTYVMWVWTVNACYMMMCPHFNGIVALSGLYSNIVHLLSNKICPLLLISIKTPWVAHCPWVLQIYYG